MIVLPISFHTNRTVPISDIGKKLNYIQLKNNKEGLVHIAYTVYTEKETLQKGTAIVTPALSNIPLSRLVREPDYTILRIDAMTPIPFTEEPYELTLILNQQ